MPIVTTPLRQKLADAQRRRATTTLNLADCAGVVSSDGAVLGPMLGHHGADGSGDVCRVTIALQHTGPAEILEHVP